MSRYAFGILLKEARLAKGMGLRAFSDAIGYSAPYVSDVENGHRKALSDDILPEVAALLGVSLKKLQVAAAASRQGGFLLPLAGDKHDKVAYLLFKKWEKLRPDQLEAILDAVS